MNRRETFKLFVAGVASLLGLKGLAKARSEPEFLGVLEAHPNAIVMGEQAHWPEWTKVYTSERFDPTEVQRFLTKGVVG